MRLAKVFCLLILLTSFGVIGYRAVEGWPWSDCLYMTVITLSTVGFQEAAPLSDEGRLFTVVLIVAGSGVALYSLGLAAELMLDGQLRQSYRRERMRMRIRNERDHVIIAGFGRFGQAVVSELLEAGKALVVIDEDAELIPVLEALDVPHVIGSVSTDQVLQQAGIEVASAIVAATPSDSENVFLTLAAKELNPKVRVFARCETDSAAKKLRRAGADQVVSPFQMGGSRTAASILRPAVVDFLEIISPRGAPEINLEEVRVASGSKLIGRRLEEIERDFTPVRIVALRRGTNPIKIAPSPSTQVGVDDLLVLIGERPVLLDLAGRAAAPAG